MNLIINADDFGVSSSVNFAVKNLYEAGKLNSTSLMVGMSEAKQAVELSKNFKNLNIGLHFNLTQGKAVSSVEKIPLLVSSDGSYKNGFVKLLCLSFLHPIKLKNQVQIELNAQLEQMRDFHITPSHLDGHRHIQMIPLIFRLMKKTQHLHNIPRLRIINESLFYTLKSHGDKRFLIDGGLVKWLVLKTLYFYNHTKSETYFYSVLHTGHLFGKNISNIRVPNQYTEVELALHPAYKIDENANSYLALQDRQDEYQAILSGITIKDM